MKHVDQENPHAENIQHSNATTSPVPSDTSARQRRQGIFLFRSWVFFVHALRFLMQKIHRKRVPELRQMSVVECGLACLAMILSYYGRKTSISELRTQYAVGRDGLSALDIVRAARSYGMRVRAISLQQNDFRFVKLPAIVHWQFNHFLIVERWTRKHVYVVDPARGRYRLTHDEFDEGFTGVVITLEPGTAFDRRATPAHSPRTLRSYVLQYIRYAPATFLQLLGASLLIELLGLALPLATKVVVDQILPFRMSNVMTVLGIGLFVLFLSQTVATLMRGWLLVYLQTRIDVHMMLGFIEHLLALPFSYFQQRSTGDLLARLSSNAMLRDILSNQMLSTLLDSSLVVFYLFILLWQSLPFGLLTLGIGVLQVLLLLISNRPVRNMASRQLAAQGKSQGYLTEALAGIATLKGSAAEQRAFERWSNLYFDQLNISLRYSYFSSTMATILTALGILAPLALLWVGATQVLNGSISLGTMVALIALAAAFFSPLAAVVMSGQQLQLIGAHLERIADVTEAEPEQKGQAVQQPPPLTGHMRLEHVGFRYASDTPEVLHGLDLRVEAGQKVAIVGPSGSGKSTLGKLLLGLYVPTEGTILYDGIPLQHLNYQEVRRQFGVVLQEATLFSGSILSNITLNTPMIDREQVIKAAEIAAIHEDIMAMPMGYETFVAEGGSALSGGQRQRLVIARAIIHTPALLLLDEATSNLDVTTEQKVAQRLQTLACTQIIIAHRLSTIRNADLILVLDQGNIVERGSHDELIQRNGYYARLMRQQLERGVVTPEIAHAVSDGHVVEAPRSDSFKEAAMTHPALSTSSNASATPTPDLPVSATSTLGSPVSVSQSRKHPALLLTLVALMFIIGIGTGFLLHAGNYGSAPSALQRSVPHANPTGKSSLLPSTSPYPSLAAAYTGTVADLMTQEKTTLLLTDIQQNQGDIHGAFQGLGLVGLFKGTLTPSGQVQFTATIYAGGESLMFEGNIKVGGDMAGSFTVLNQHEQRTNESGLWNVAPNP